MRRAPDAADVAQRILYEPLAEDNGLTLHVETEPARRPDFRIKAGFP
jgi:hypothetical protein